MFGICKEETYMHIKSTILFVGNVDKNIANYIKNEAKYENIFMYNWFQ